MTEVAVMEHRKCPNCGSPARKHDEVACEEYEAWLELRDDDAMASWDDEDE